ncbi:MAG: DNA circularization N-terminal domain-containing protein [Gammaproteobacteria bacterium]|nr:DNA circularization N-terminal domain-containing protein [Gammaproteobacteria bacterium]
MSWRDQLRPASFRGVAFRYEETDTELGRRNHLHEYPDRDLPYVEDLGRKAKTFSIEAYVIGDDYMAQRDALEAALDAEGPGELIHPRYGARNVSVTAARVRETTRQGRMAVFSITFTEAGNRSEPSATTATDKQTQSAAGGLATAAENELADNFDIDGQPGWVSLGVTDTLNSFTSQLNQVQGMIAGPGNAVADFTGAITRFENELTGLLQTPAALATNITSLVAALESLPGNVANSLQVYETLFDFSVAAPAANTAAAQTLVRSQQQLVHLVKVAAVAGAARVSSQIPFDSSAEALAARDWLLAAMDSLANYTDPVTGLPADDGEYDALSALRHAVVEDLNTRAAKLPQIVSHTLNHYVPAVVLAWDLYGDAERGDEIVARNHVARPGFLPAGEPLEVLNA